MPTIIDSLIVTLGLDRSDFEKGEKETGAAIERTQERADKTGKQMEAGGTRAGQFFGRVRSQVIGLAAAFLSVRTISQFVSDITTADRATGLLAANLGMSVEELSAWQNRIQLFGGTAAQMDADFKRMSESVNQWMITGNLPVQLLQALQAAGVSARDFLDKSKTFPERLYMLADALEKMDKSKRLTFGNLFGISEATTNMLSGGSAAVRKMIEDQKKLNSLKPEDVEAAKERAAVWFDMTQKVEAAGRSIVTKFTPFLMEAYEWMGKLAEKSAAAFDKWINSGGDTPALRDKEGRLRNPSAYGGLGSDVQKKDEALGNWTRGRRAGGQIRGAGQAAPASAMDGLDASRQQAQWPDAAGSPAGPSAGVNKAAASAAGATSKLSLGTLLTIKELLNQAQTNREAVIRILDSYRIVQQKDQAMFDKIMRQELGLSATVAPRAAAGSKTEISMENHITINTRATDGVGIARELGPAMRQFALAAQINPGLA